MFYTIYRITNKVNGKVYIGKHKTENLDDGYMGSGKLLKRAIVKYGLDNFQKDYICFCDNEEQMNLMERKFVDEVAVANNQVYNIKLGGQGGFDFIKENKLSYYYTDPHKHIEVAKNNLKNANVILHNKLKSNNEFSIIRNRKIGEKSKGRKPFLGKSHTEEAKLAIGKANSENQKGQHNSQFGTCWITNGLNNRKIPKSDLNKWIANGYRRGRVIIS